MVRPYSLDLRERVVRAVEEEGLSRRQAAARFGVSVSSAIKWVERYRSTGSFAPGKMGGHRTKKSLANTLSGCLSVVSERILHCSAWCANLRYGAFGLITARSGLLLTKKG